MMAVIDHPAPVAAPSCDGQHIDGREYVDFCLSDTGTMIGLSPAPTVATVVAQAAIRPDHTAADVDRSCRIFDEALVEMFGG